MSRLFFVTCTCVGFCWASAVALSQETSKTRSAKDGISRSAGFTDLPPPQPMRSEGTAAQNKTAGSQATEAPLRLNRPLRLSTTPATDERSERSSEMPGRKTLPAATDSDMIVPPKIPASKAEAITDSKKEMLIPSVSRAPTQTPSKSAPRILSIEPTAGSTIKRNDQSLSLEWLAPTQIKVGRPFTYELIVRNNGQQKIMNVAVQDKLPAGIKLKSSDPICSENDGNMNWSLGELAPRQERRIRVELQAEKRGDFLCQATVTASTPATAKLSVTEPKIAIKASCLQEVHVGEPVTISMVVYNPGDGQADNVIVNATLPEGLTHERGNELHFDVGSIAAGETKNVNLTVNAVKSGIQSVITRATGEGGLASTNDVKTTVIEPMLVVA